MKYDVSQQASYYEANFERLVWLVPALASAPDSIRGILLSHGADGMSLQLTMLRYKGGEATVLEVVDAQTTYSQANFAYQDRAVRYRVALANLQTLTGVLTSP